METHERKSVPIVTEFNIQGSSWAPGTPLKPILHRPGPIYGDGQGGLVSQAFDRESEEYLSRFSQLDQDQSRLRARAQLQGQAQAQALLSCSISSAERSYAYNNNNENNFWDAQGNPLTGRINLERENVGSQRRGLEDYLPNWSSQGRRKTPSLSPANPAQSSSSSYPMMFSSWELPQAWKNNGVRENGSMLEQNRDDPLVRLNNMSFGDLLAMNGSAFEPSMVSTRLGGDSGDVPTTRPFPSGWDCQPEYSRLDINSTVYRNQGPLHDLNQQVNGICGQEMHSAFLHQQWNNINSPPSTKHANGNNSTFEPPTPDLRWRADSVVASGNINLGTDQRSNGLQEHEVAAAMVNLQNLNHQEVTEPATDSSAGKVSTAVEEVHNADKEADHEFDLNKTPQKKPRRKRYTPKVIKENKPKQTPKPKTPKPADATEVPRTKRKYVRKNKMNTPSTTCPAEATKTSDPEPTEPVKSCRKSLNFDLNGQVTEQNSVHMSNGGSYADPQLNDPQIAGNQSSQTVHLRQEEGLMVKTSQIGIAYDLNCTLSQELKNYISLPEKDNLDSSYPDQTILTKGKGTAGSSLLGQNPEVPSRTDTSLAQSPNSSPCTSSNEAVKTRGSKRGHSSISETIDVDAGNLVANHCSYWQPNPTFQGNGTINGVPRFFFPEISKKKRTEKVQRSHASCTSSSATASEDVSQAASTQNHPRIGLTASNYYYCNSAPFGNNAVPDNRVEMLRRSMENRAKLINTWADIARWKKKRTKGTTRVRDMAPLKGIASVSPAIPAAKRHRRKSDISDKPYPGTPSNINLSNSVYSCMVALTEDTHGTPKSKRKSRKQNSAFNSMTSKVNKHRDLVLYDGNQSTRKRTGSVTALRLVDNSLEAITEGLKQLNINRKARKTSSQAQNALVPYRVNNQEHNALVPYRHDSTIVPFEGPFDPIRKRRQRAKVDLDDETTRVWRLLLENIDNQGIDGTDEDKAKWWENERGVFRGRVDSFIARMRLVQGDRRFTPWKGSVLDSVIGVFLTQNVSDHLSSSAFMALAARFPLKPESSESTLSEEASSALVVEPEICIIEPEESIAWIEKSLDQPICDRNSRIIHEIDLSEEKEVVNSKEKIGGAPGSISPVDYSSESSQKAHNELRINKEHSHTTDTEVASVLGDERARDDATSSQQSVISSQNSVNSPTFQTVAMMGTFSESNSRAQTSSQGSYLDCSTSFLGLLQMAENPLLHKPYGQILGLDQPECMKHVTKDSPEAPGISSNDYQVHLKTDFHLQATTGIEMLEVESRSSDTSRKDENSTTEQSNFTTESTVQQVVKEKSSDGIPISFVENASSCYVLEGENMVIQSQGQSMKEPLDNVTSSAKGQTNPTWKSPNLPKLSQEMADVTESTTTLDRKNNYQKEVERSSKHNPASAGISDITQANTSKPKRVRSVKDKRHAYDWDSLRKEAQPNGKKRERTSNTRDSLDWEAVRLADVSEIAETIKERGMNNMLAERIKDLLDRLVQEHGSTDMEWLRDIPPDKAKEYLLSFRGLGLKSVECVRLLTLHHLAFPVDTNVGRIAVRLGWVPLQPLPESLQLHLLEMYPILESIQKYLWPRLCKLDQKTLYELHYHMITFGKVFCTKRQPNCNACPLRGECRHFASAFASARLALPGPEEKSIVVSTEGGSTHRDPRANINPLQLPPSWGNHHPETNIRPLIEVPPTPLSLSAPQTIHHLERRCGITCEPIVEVPASPEPEQEQTLCDIEDYEDPDEIPTIKLNMKEFTQTLENYMQGNRELQETALSRALVALTPEAASIPTPKLKNISRLRTEHHVYELPDSHPLLKGLDKREPDDPCSYLLAIWTPGETANSIQPPERRCSSEDPNLLCNEQTCAYCSSQREANSQIVRGTLLIPCRTAMRGSFPLNGTYFQVNEVFADHDSSLNPVDVPRSWLWNLPRRTVYFGTSIPTIFRGLNTEDIQHCFWRGYVCVRGFDQKRRAPRPLMARLHFPASKMPRGAKGKGYDE